MLTSRFRSKPFISRAAFVALTALLCAAVVVPDADARRLGGGRAFGRQSPNATQQQAQPPARQALPAQPAQAAPGQKPAAQTPAQPAPNRWLGPIGGLAAGLGIAALLSHLGLVGPLAELLASALMIGLLVFAAMFLWRMLRGARAPRPAAHRLEPAFNMAHAAGARPGSVADTAGLRPVGASAPAAPMAPRAAGVPQDFDVEAFVRTAKVHFLRLQAAWDARNLADISEFTTPEVFAEIRVQLDEDSDAADRTEVLKLEAELLGIEDGPEDWLASVRFGGTIRENPAGPAKPFHEIWNLSKRKKRGAGWLLAGIQQLH
jgi:predicted lipid-binding transport protein (Tim44 family)